MEKIAFLILTHHDPEQLKRLVCALDDPAFDCYIHIDAKSDIAQFHFDQYRLQYGNPVVLDRRVKVSWGNYSVTQAMIQLYEAAFSSDQNYCRFVMLSGNDYPLASDEVIYQTLTDMSREFIMGHPTEHPEKVTLYHYMHSANLYEKAIRRLFHTLKIKNKHRLIVYGKELPVYFSPQWNALSRECVAYFLQAIRDNQAIIDQFFKLSYASDELLIPTLVFNNEALRRKTLRSEFPKDTPYNDKLAIHYINYLPWTPVQVFTEEDAETLLSSGKLFARKFSTGQSDKLIEIIDSRRNGKYANQ